MYDFNQQHSEGEPLAYILFKISTKLLSVDSPLRKVHRSTSEGHKPIFDGHRLC